MVLSKFKRKEVNLNKRIVGKYGEIYPILEGVRSKSSAELLNFMLLEGKKFKFMEEGVGVVKNNLSSNVFLFLYLKNAIEEDGKSIIYSNLSLIHIDRDEIINQFNIEEKINKLNRAIKGKRNLMEFLKISRFEIKRNLIFIDFYREGKRFFKERVKVDLSQVY